MFCLDDYVILCHLPLYSSDELYFLTISYLKIKRFLIWIIYIRLKIIGNGQQIDKNINNSNFHHIMIHVGYIDDMIFTIAGLGYFFSFLLNSL